MGDEKRGVFSELIFQIGEAFKARDRKRKRFHLELATRQLDGLRATHSTFLEILRTLRAPLSELELQARRGANDLEPSIEAVFIALGVAESVRALDRPGRRERWEMAHAFSVGDLAFRGVLSILNPEETALFQTFLTNVESYAQIDSPYAHDIGHILRLVGFATKAWRETGRVDLEVLRRVLTNIDEAESRITEHWGRCTASYALLDAGVMHGLGHVRGVSSARDSTTHE